MCDNCKYEIFIRGESIDLVIPNDLAIEEDGWHTWFNDPVTTRYLLKFGVFPNTKQKQYEFLKSVSSENEEKIVLLVLPKGSDKVIGVAHLGDINYKHRSGHFGMVLGVRSVSAKNISISLEVKARMVEHGFEKIGLERIWGSQVTKLEMWQRYQVLLGFKPEGITRRSFRKGRLCYDEIITSCLLEDYLKLKDKRNGAFWPGRNKMHQLIRTIPKASLVDDISKALEGAYEKYMNDIMLY